MGNGCQCLFTVPLQVLTSTDNLKPFQTGSVFTSMLCWWAHFYEDRYKFRVDGLITVSS